MNSVEIPFNLAGCAGTLTGLLDHQDQRLGCAKWLSVSRFLPLLLLLFVLFVAELRLCVRFVMRL